MLNLNSQHFNTILSDYLANYAEHDLERGRRKSTKKLPGERRFGSEKLS